MNSAPGNKLPEIDQLWSLFLDRDGVINIEKDEDYVRNAGEFYFYPGVTEAIAIFNRLFGKVFIVTNQRGVGRGLMTEADLNNIHKHMENAIADAGGYIDRIYYCTDTDIDSFYRKPNPGMGHKAKADFPQIDFNKSIMVGNTTSDMQFGRNLGMFTVFIPSTKPMPDLPHLLIDLVSTDLFALAKALQKQQGAQ